MVKFYFIDLQFHNSLFIALERALKHCVIWLFPKTVNKTIYKNCRYSLTLSKQIIVAVLLFVDLRSV